MIPEPVGIDVVGFGWRHASRNRWALRDVSFTVEPGERVLIAGPSGGGKSTLLRALAGIAARDTAAETEGEIRYRASRHPLDPGGARARSGFLMQDPESNLIMPRVGDDIAFGLENARVPQGEIWQRVRAALGDVGFRYGLDRPTSALSGGEKQRVAFAGALARRPGLLILDEPTANLDPAGAREVVASLADVIGQTGITLVLVDHRLDQIMDLVDRVVVLRDGGIVLDAPLERALASDARVLTESGIFIPGGVVSAGGPAANSPGQAPVVRAEDVIIVRGPTRQPAVDGVSVGVGSGAALALLGPNGAGKSTLARALGGLLRPTSGRALAAGERRPLHRVPSRKLARLVGSVFQEPEHQFVAGSVSAEVEVGARAVGQSNAAAKATARQILERLHLDALAASNPFTLSGGEKRRLAVGAALAGEPAALILDEPTYAQDAITWAATVDLLREQLGEGRAMIVVTHEDPLVRALGAERVELREGRRVA